MIRGDVPALRVLIGAPAAGKTTWCRSRGRELGTVLSLDAARAIVGTGEEDQAVTPEAVAFVRGQAAEALAAGRNVTIDATGAAADPDRATWLALAREYGAEPVAVVFRSPLGHCLGRNALRERQVPDEALVTMWLAIRATGPGELHREGFARVSTVHPGAAVAAADDPRNWRYPAELTGGMAIHNPAPDTYPYRRSDECALDVVAVSEPDQDGFVTITTTHPGSLVIAADWGVWLFTEDDAALITYLMATEPTTEERDR